MKIVTVSPKYQVVIPSSMRKSLGIKPGQKLMAVSIGDCIEYVPFRNIRMMRGFVKNIESPPFIREKDDRI
ncbi:AbrB/MazE/SpoVT family DNA-binding domain-containing protein [Candidatus Sumerlaeota bacterium]|nr:AbrB/MazE/SpoVT family DNA-binding domain-containing protein [Candidatus Sumerlaeota bacterium]